MKKLMVGILVAVILSSVVVGVYAAPEAATTGKVGPYEGSFQGMAYGDKGSRAPLTLELTHRGNQVKGEMVLSEGLYVDGGFCGKVNVPATEQYLAGQTVAGNPRRLVANPTLDAGGLDLSVDFESNVSTDGAVITARAKVDLPWFCGRDPVLTVMLYRD
jgi:hypothetical protein